MGTRPQKLADGRTVRIPILKPGSKTKEAITDPAVLARLERAAKELSARHWAVYVILRRTGMHTSILAELNVNNLREGALVWARTKTSRVMRAKVDAVLATALNIHFAAGPKSDVWYWKMVKAIGEAGGVPKLSPMTLRHTRAVELLLRGVSPVVVCQIMGCSLRVLQAHYGVLSDAQLMEVG